MKPLVATLVLLSISISCFAEITVDDLPYLEDTPLLERVDDIPVWSVLDYAEEDGVVQWAWLDNAGDSAYVVYPSDDEALLPDNSVIPASDHMLTLRFVGENQEYTFSRYGGETVVSGDEIIFGYTAPDKTHSLDGDFLDGDLFISAEDIRITGFFNGDFRHITIFAQDELMVDEPNSGSGLSGNSGPGSTICSGSSVSISSDPNFYTPESGCPSDGNSSFGNSGSALIIDPSFNILVVPAETIDISQMTPCRLPEPHEYTGKKKVLCGENWVEVSDEDWAGMIAYSGASYLEEAPQEQNPPKKKKSKGGAVPFSILLLLLLVHVFRSTNRRSTF